MPLQQMARTRTKQQLAPGHRLPPRAKSASYRVIGDKVAPAAGANSTTDMLNLIQSKEHMPIGRQSIPVQHNRELGWQAAAALAIPPGRQADAEAHAPSRAAPAAPAVEITPAAEQMSATSAAEEVVTLSQHEQNPAGTAIPPTTSTGTEASAPPRSAERKSVANAVNAAPPVLDGAIMQQLEDAHADDRQQPSVHASAAVEVVVARQTEPSTAAIMDVQQAPALLPPCTDAPLSQQNALSEPAGSELSNQGLSADVNRAHQQPLPSHTSPPTDADDRPDVIAGIFTDKPLLAQQLLPQPLNFASRQPAVSKEGMHPRSLGMAAQLRSLHCLMAAGAPSSQPAHPVQPMVAALAERADAEVRLCLSSCRASCWIR